MTKSDFGSSHFRAGDKCAYNPNAFRALAAHKSNGSDGIHPQRLKTLAPEIRVCSGVPQGFVLGSMVGTSEDIVMFWRISGKYLSDRKFRACD